MMLTQVHTDRLLIREAKLEDWPAVHAMHSLPEIDKYNTLGIPEDEQSTKDIVGRWITEQTDEMWRNRAFMVVDKATEAIVGECGLRAGRVKYGEGEIWFKFHVDFWGQGFATETAKALLAFGFDTLKMHRIEAGCAVENRASAGVLEKIGMTREGLKRKVLPIRGEWVDNYEYAILEGDVRGGILG
jgi:ribosomal-protein-alanine N-acetyltransferase